MIEPSPDVRDLFTRLLARLGHETTFVADGGPVDVAIVEPTAAEAAAAVEQLRAARPDMPVVCVSVAPKSAETALGCVAYLVKPVHLDQLRAAVDCALGR